MARQVHDVLLVIITSQFKYEHGASLDAGSLFDRLQSCVWANACGAIHDLSMIILYWLSISYLCSQALNRGECKDSADDGNATEDWHEACCVRFEVILLVII